MRKLRQLFRHFQHQIRNKQEKVEPAGIPIDEKMKKYIWNEYLESLKILRAKYPDDFKNTPLEPKMPSDINEIFKLRNDLYKYMNPCYSDTYW